MLLWPPHTHVVTISLAMRQAAGDREADAVVTFRLMCGEIGDSSMMVTAQGTTVGGAVAEKPSGGDDDV